MMEPLLVQAQKSSPPATTTTRSLMLLIVVVMWILLLTIALLGSNSSTVAVAGAVATTTSSSSSSTVEDRDHDRDDDVIHLQLHLNHSNTIAGMVDSRYVSYTMDYPGNNNPHHKSNVLRLNLKSNELLTLTRALGPAFFRIGGTKDKVVQYDFPTNHGVRCTDTSNSSSGRPNDYKPCLTSKRWDGLHEFAAATNSQIVFGLSYPDQITGHWTAFNQTRALLEYSSRQNYTRQTTFWGVELGEELTKFDIHSSAFQNYVAGYQSCSRLLQTVFPSSNRRPLLMGPCPGMSWPRLATWFPALLKATRNVLDIAVYHSYNQIEPGHLYVNLTVPSGSIYTQKGWSPGDTGWQAVAMKRFVEDEQRHQKQHQPKLQSLWLGEMASHNHVGGNAICGTFASSFSYLDTLGTLARLNHQVIARQTLTGGSYGLLRAIANDDGGNSGGGDDDHTKFEPRPDYWIALLWKRLMGRIVLPAPTVSLSHPQEEQQQQQQQASTDNLKKDEEDSWWKEPLQFHAHCSRVDDHDDNNSGGGGDGVGVGTTAAAGSGGSVTITFSNMSPNQTYVITTMNMLGRTRIEYILGSHPRANGFDSELLELNGNVLRVNHRHDNHNSSLLPSLKGRVVDNQLPLVVEPVTLGFVVFPDANVPACRRQNHITESIK